MHCWTPNSGIKWKNTVQNICDKQQSNEKMKYKNRNIFIVSNNFINEVTLFCNFVKWICAQFIFILVGTKWNLIHFCQTDFILRLHQIDRSRNRKLKKKRWIFKLPRLPNGFLNCALFIQRIACVLVLNLIFERTHIESCECISAMLSSLNFCECWSKLRLCRIVMMTLMTYKFYQFTALSAKFISSGLAHLDRSIQKLNMWKALTNHPKNHIKLKPLLFVYVLYCESVFFFFSPSPKPFCCFIFQSILCAHVVWIFAFYGQRTINFFAPVANGNWLHNF